MPQAAYRNRRVPSTSVAPRTPTTRGVQREMWGQGWNVYGLVACGAQLEEASVLGQPERIPADVRTWSRRQRRRHRTRGAAVTTARTR